MLLKKIKYIFIHNEKAAGNFLQYEFLKNKLSDEKIIKKDHDDGKHNFSIIGEFTINKHQNVEVYKKFLKKSFTDYKLITNVRDPLDRLISWYFANDINLTTTKFIKKINHFLFKRFKTNLPMSKYFYNYKQPNFSEQKFIDFIKFVPSQKDKFLVNQEYLTPDKIIYFDNLEECLKNFFEENELIFEISKIKKNTKKYVFDKNIVYKNENILNEFINSPHFADYEFFKINKPNFLI